MARQRGKTFQGDVKLGAQRYRQAFDTMAQADAWEAAMRLAHEEGRPLPIHGVVGTGGGKAMTLGELRKLVEAAEWRGKKAEEGLCRNGRIVTDYFGANVALDAITTERIDQFIQDLKDAGNANGTINRKLAALRKMLRFAHRRGRLKALPHLSRQKEGEGRLRWITDAEEARILATLRTWGWPDYADLAAFLVDTGARLGEALSLRWEDVQPSRVTFWITKGGKPRTVPLTPRVQAILTARRERLGDTAGPFAGVSRWHLRSVWDRMRTHLDMDDVVVHTLRHTCCSRLVQGGMDLLRVMKWMGHSSFVTTQRYAHLAPKDLDEGVEILAKKKSPALQQA